MIIDRVFVMVLLLSISGFVFCAVFVPFEGYAYRLTSAKTMVSVNTVALFSFVVPLYFINSIYDGSERILTAGNVLVFEDSVEYESTAATIRKLSVIENLRYIWLAGATIFLAVHIWEYVRFLKNIMEGSFKLTGGAWAECFAAIKENSSRTRVELIGSCTVCTPCTIGVINKKIVIPAAMINSFSEKEIKFILSHEFYHVIHNDMPRKLLIIVLNTLNWFNPMFYFLRKSLSDWQEMACDDEVTRNFSKEECDEYCCLIVTVADMEYQMKEKGSFEVNFKGNAVYKRRISRIMKKKNNNSKIGKAVVYSMALCAMISGSVVAKAADVPVNQIFSNNGEVVSSEIIEEGNFESEIAVAYYDAEDIPCTTVYNNIADVPIEPQHSHNFVDTQLKQHQKNSDGSCVTTYYEAKKCTKCGVIVKGDKINTITMEVCIH